jgi:hypothetical protein
MCDPSVSYALSPPLWYSIWLLHVFIGLANKKWAESRKAGQPLTCRTFHTDISAYMSTIMASSDACSQCKEHIPLWYCVLASKGQCVRTAFFRQVSSSAPHRRPLPMWPSRASIIFRSAPPGALPSIDRRHKRSRSWVSPAELCLAARPNMDIR